MLTPNFNFFCKSANLCYNYLVNFNKGIGVSLQIYEKKRKIYLSQNRTSPHRDLLSHCARAGSGRGCRFGVRSLPLPAEQSGKRQPYGTHRHCRQAAVHCAVLSGTGGDRLPGLSAGAMAASVVLQRYSPNHRGNSRSPGRPLVASAVGKDRRRHPVHSQRTEPGARRSQYSAGWYGSQRDCQDYQGGQNHAAAHDQLRRRCRTGSGI